MVLIALALISVIGSIPHKLPICIVLFVLYTIHFYRKLKKYPPGPRPLPLIGNVHQLTQGRVQHDLERFRKEYGDVFTVCLFNDPMVVLMRSDVIKEALVDKGEFFENRTGQLFERIFQTIENGGILLSSGESWRKQRRTAIHILRDFGIGKTSLDAHIHIVLEKFVRRLEQEEDLNGVDLHWPVQIFTACAISHLLYGDVEQNPVELREYVENMTGVMKDMQQNVFALLYQFVPAIRRVPWLGYKAVKKYEELYGKCISKVKEDVTRALKGYSREQPPECFAQAYYQKMAEDPELTMDQLHNLAADFFFAGIETTSATILWAMLRLAEHQEIQDRIRQEVNGINGSDRLLDSQDKLKMPYTQAFLAEIQRFSNVSPGNLMRRTTEDTVVGGVHIPKGAIVLPQVYGALLDEKLFENPNELVIDRYLNEDGSFDTSLVAKTLTFGIGKRKCPGESLAKAELFIFITSMIQRYRILPSEKAPLDFTGQPGTITYPASNFLKLERIH